MTRCHRCQGFLYQDSESVHCLNCGEWMSKKMPYGYREMTCEACKGKRKVYRQPAMTTAEIAAHFKAGLTMHRLAVKCGVNILTIEKAIRRWLMLYAEGRKG